MSHQIPAKLRKQVYERSGMLCEVCGSRGLEIHHIVKRSNWRECERLESLILLCWDCHHDNIENGNGNLKLKLKLDLQLAYFELGYTNEETRELMGGRLYFENNM